MAVHNREDFLKKYNNAVIKVFNERSKKESKCGSLKGETV